MTMTTFDKENTKLFIPHLWDRDWEEVINESEESYKYPLRAQHLLVSLTKDIEDVSFTFERASWLCLWSRLFKILEGLQALGHDRSGLSFPCFERMYFEFYLHIITISEEAPKERLKAYFAWSIYHDLKYNEFHLNPDIMGGIWNIQTEKKILEDEELRKLHEKFFIMDTETWITDKKEAKKRMLESQDRLQHEIAWMQSVLSNPELKGWYNKISQLSEKKSKSYVPSFFNLFEKTGSDIRSRLRQIESEFGDMDFAYSLYKSSSRTIHGSSLMDNLHFEKGQVTPDLIMSKTSIDDGIKQLGTQGYDILPMLLLLKNHAWPNK